MQYFPTISTFLVFLLVATVTPQFSPNYYRNYYQNYQPYQNAPNYYRNQASNSYQSYQQYPNVAYNRANEEIWGGPTNLGWAQVPRHLSPQFSPVFGRK